MRIRTRKNNTTGDTFESLSLVRSVYDPSKKRSREVYIGSVSREALPSEVPGNVVLRRGVQLTDEEVEQLKTHLAPNTPDPTSWLTGLPKYMRYGIKELESYSLELRRNGSNPKDTLGPLIDEIEKSWNEFFRAAQAAGLKRTLRRRKPSAEFEGTPEKQM